MWMIEKAANEPTTFFVQIALKLLKAARGSKWLLLNTEKKVLLT